MTLAQLRALLALSHGPAVERLTDRTPEGVARVYLPWFVWMLTDSGRTDAWLMPAGANPGHQRLDLKEPGTVVAVRAALALARGFDPSNGVKWKRNGADNAWILDASDWCAFATSTAARSVTPSRRVIEADMVGTEPDNTRALVLAVEHVLGASGDR